MMTASTAAHNLKTLFAQIAVLRHKQTQLHSKHPFHSQGSSLLLHNGTIPRRNQPTNSRAIHRAFRCPSPKRKA